MTDSANKWGLLAAGIVTGFGVVNIVRPMDLYFLQATCGRPMFFPCNVPPQALTETGVRVFGSIAVVLGLGIAWLSWQKR